MKKIVITSISLFFILSIIALVVIYNKSTTPLEEKQTMAIARAQEAAELVSIDHVDWFHYQDAYMIVEGTDQDGKDLIVWVPEDKEKDMIITGKKEGLSREEVLSIMQYGLPDLSQGSRPREILRIKYGMVENTPVYEVTYIDQHNRYSILYLDFYEGEWYRVFNL